MPLLLWYGIEPLVAAASEQALVLARESRIEKVTRFLYRRAGLEPGLRPELVRVIANETDPARRTLVLDELATAVRDARGLVAPAGWPELYAKLVEASDPHVRDQALELAIAFGDASAFPALRALVRGGDARTPAVLLAQIDESALRGAALRGLAAFAAEGTASALLERYAGFSADERRDALATLCSRSGWARELLAAVGAGRVAKSELSAFQLRALRQLGDTEVARMLDLYVGQVRAEDAGKEREIARVRAVLEQDGAADLARGREVFARTCQQCHVLFGAGGGLGPDLTGANRGDREYLLSNVIDPSGVVANEYRTTVARLLDGRLVTASSARTRRARSRCRPRPSARPWRSTRSRSSSSPRCRVRRGRPHCPGGRHPDRSRDRPSARLRVRHDGL